jgi:hypothetical protein
MTRFMYLLDNLSQLAQTLLTLLVDGVCFLGLRLCPSPALAAENLFLRKQLALYQERHVTSRRTTHAIRMVLVGSIRSFLRFL